jgi:integrase
MMPALSSPPLRRSTLSSPSTSRRCSTPDRGRASPCHGSARVCAHEAAAWTRRKKKGIASDVRLRPELAEGLRAHLASHDRRRVFRFHQGGHFNHLLVRAKLKALGVPCPTRRPTGWRQPPNRLTWVNFKTFRHTWATWMRIYGGLDDDGLQATHNWRDRKRVGRYSHAVARHEWSKVELLPDISERKKA